MGIFSRRIGQEYMSKCVGAVVRDLVFNDKLDFELDPLKLSGEENVEAVVERNKEALISHAKSLLRRITSDDKTENMPREIRATAGFIAEYARKYTPDREAALVGGFIMLRLLNPSLVAPESYGMLPWGKVPSMKARRNLILLTKLLQNLSNGIEFGVKEQHMKVVNSFIIENKDLINNWFTSITTDPLQQEGREPWEDCKYLRLQWSWDVTALDLSELIFLHKMLHQHMDKLKELLVQAKDTLSPKDYNLSLDILKAMAAMEIPKI
eukprot:TRINITY_DN6109_c0_g1_i5.p1 TRINITY_DN6109_c0_g1~~TRINITY_DN6109_c0_g1_i5.p1  ORF type:complete len:267 (-),score=49.65 TRINITY_DN6109_c0_g1_i5:81-881(-)